MIHIFKSAAAKLWFALLLSLILLGVGIQAARLVLPLLAEYRADVEAQASAALGVPVRLGGIGARLRGFSPELELRDVALLDPKTGEPALSFAEVRVAVNTLETLLSWEPSFGEVTLSGADSVVQRLEDGSLRVRGIMRHTEIDLMPVLRGFLRQGHYRLRDSVLVWESPGVEPLRMTGLELHVVNDGARHQVDVRLQIAGVEGAEARVALDLWGEPGVGSGLHGEFYVQGRHLPLRHLAAVWDPSQYPIGTGEMDLELWGSVGEAHPLSLSGSLALKDVQVLGSGGGDRPPPSWSLEQLSADLDWRQLAGGWRLHVSRLRLSRHQREWPEGRFSLQTEQGEQGRTLVRAGFDYLRLDDLIQARDLVPLPEAAREALSSLQPAADIRDLRVRLEIGDTGVPVWSAWGRVIGLHSASWGRLPAIEGGTLRFWAYQDRGVLELDSPELRLTFPELFRHPLQAERAQGLLQWERRRDGTLVLEADDLSVDTPHIRTRSRLYLELPRSELSPFLELHVDFHDGDAAGTSYYLPVGIMRPGLVDWLDQAIVSGRVPEGSALVRGRLKAFPFAKDEGRFEVSFDVSDLALDYLPRWPRLEAVAARVRFFGNSMRVAAREGSLLDSRIEEAEAEILSLNPTGPLTVTGRLRGPLADGLRVLSETPLEKRFGGLVAAMQASGESDVSLGLNVPLGKGEARPVQVTGDLTLADSGLELTDVELPLEHLAGALRFTEAGVSAKGIRAEVLGVPLVIDIERQGVDAGGGTRVSARGEVPVRVLEQRYPHIGLRHFSGSSDWTIQVDVPTPRAGENPVRHVELSSDLRGVTVELPAPLGKPAALPMPLRLSTDIARDPYMRYDLRYGDLLDAALRVERLPGGGTALERCQVLFGGGKAELSDEPGLYLGGTLDALALEPWLDWARSGQPGDDGGGTQADLLQGIDLRIGTLRLGQSELRDAKLALRRRKGGWEGRLATARMGGEIRFPHDTTASPLVLKLEHLDLDLDLDLAAGEEPQPPDETAAADPRDMPALDLTVEELRVNGNPLGRFRLSGQRIGAGLRFDALELRGPVIELSGQGGWTLEDGQAVARLDLQAASEDVPALLASLGIASPLESGASRAEVQLHWYDSLTPDSLEDLRGEFSVHVSKGRFLEVDPGLGRVFGLLSLRALQRRLSLDFSDLFNQGLAFDRIEGSFLLEAGSAYTTDSYLEGPAARIDIMGRTGLVSQDYDQYVTVTPHLSTGLPVAAALAGGPAVGAAVLVAQQLMGKQLEKITRYQYEVVGPWKDPVITRVETRPKESRRPDLLDGTH